MDLTDLHPPDDYSHRFFIWHEWIQANGPLTTENVFEYFTTSMFYDKQSNNQVLRMQTMHTGMPIVNEAEELKRFTGVEFALVHSQPPSLFIIQKRDRLSPDEVRPLAAYFIMNNRIYQSPDIYNVVSNRLLTAVRSLQSSLDILREHRPNYTPRMGFVWPIVDVATSATNPEVRRRGATEEPVPPESSVLAQPKAAPERKQKQQNNMLLLNAMRTTAAHSSMSFTAAQQALASADAGAAATSAAETPAARSQQSATPAPPATRRPTPKRVASDPAAEGLAPQPPVKGVPGAGKKKRKRTLMAQPPA